MKDLEGQFVSTLDKAHPLKAQGVDVEREHILNRSLRGEMPENDRGVAARHSSKTDAHFTPSYIVEAARSTLGGIDLDPFSCNAANETVGAPIIFRGPLDGDLAAGGADGFVLDWFGRVFCNPPGGKGSNNESNQKRAWFKLASEYAAGRVTAAIFVCFSVELLQTTQSKTPAGLALPLDFPICYPSKRVAYVRDDGTVGGSPPHSSCIIYLPAGGPKWGMQHPGTQEFRDVFSLIGKVVIPS